MAAKKGSLIAVLVTTKLRGVFFGYIDPKDVEKEVLSIVNCRNVLFWSSDVKGFLGLTTSGPSKSCRVGPASAKVRLHDISSVSDVSPEAVKAFEAAPWG